MIDYSSIDNLQALAEEYEMEYNYAEASKLYAQIASVWSDEALAADESDRDKYQSFADYWKYVADRAQEVAQTQASMRPQSASRPTVSSHFTESHEEMTAKALKSLKRARGITGFVQDTRTANQVRDRRTQQSCDFDVSSMTNSISSLSSAQAPKTLKRGPGKSYFDDKPR